MNSILNNLTLTTCQQRVVKATSRKLRRLLAGTVCLALLMPALQVQAAAADTAVAAETGDSAARDGSFLVTLSDEGWISDVGVLLYADEDRDGFFSGLGMSIDADTAFASNEVFATIDIASTNSALGNGGFTRLYTTLPFYIYRQNSSDEYRIDVDLLSNYSPDSYDLLVTLVDARSNRILDQVGAFEFRNLSAVPLESADFDGVFVPVVDRPQNFPQNDVVAVEYRGASGPLVLAVLLLGVLWRIRRSVAD